MFSTYSLLRLGIFETTLYIPGLILHTRVTQATMPAFLSLSPVSSPSNTSGYLRSGSIISDKYVSTSDNFRFFEPSHTSQDLSQQTGLIG
jgi:hypothetical protein